MASGTFGARLPLPRTCAEDSASDITMAAPRAAPLKAKADVKRWDFGAFMVRLFFKGLLIWGVAGDSFAVAPCGLIPATRHRTPRHVLGPAGRGGQRHA